MRKGQGKYRLGVGIMLLNNAKQVFVGQRLDKVSDAWQMPQGGVDKGENLLHAVMRELKEELGTDKAEIIYQSKNWYLYDLPPELASKLWGGRYAGQKQKWFLMKFLGEDKDIDIATKIPEFISWKWVEVDKLTKIIVPFKRKLYTDVVKEFNPVITDLL
jgi:putative (di)nucleoside polyphosphate hydrolase